MVSRPGPPRGRSLPRDPLLVNFTEVLEIAETRPKNAGFTENLQPFAGKSTKFGKFGKWDIQRGCFQNTYGPFAKEKNKFKFDDVINYWINFNIHNDKKKYF